MAKRRSTAASRRYMNELPEQLLQRLLPGAARAGAKVIAAKVREELGGKTAAGPGGVEVLIANSVKVRVRRDGDRIIGRVALIGPGSYVARWLEYGTAPHFISVDRDHAGGRTARRINKLDKAAAEDGREGPGRSLFINGEPAGSSVFHPGARPNPFLRPAFDLAHDAAIEAARSYVTSRATRAGVGHNGGPALGGDA